MRGRGESVFRDGNSWECRGDSKNRCRLWSRCNSLQTRSTGRCGCAAHRRHGRHGHGHGHRQGGHALGRGGCGGGAIIHRLVRPHLQRGGVRDLNFLFILLFLLGLRVGRRLASKAPQRRSAHLAVHRAMQGQLCAQVRINAGNLMGTAYSFLK